MAMIKVCQLMRCTGFMEKTYFDKLNQLEPITPPSETARYIQLASGTKLLLYKKFTFSRSGKTRGGGSRFTCSCALSKSCKAHVHVDKDNHITSASAEHSHEPLKYMSTPEGYVRINPKFPYHFDVQHEVFED
ncbi:jg8417 [Pararge aegeria aegeria]|uniref:Jg8417 protein n=1 Tax=Pararge aegeria aegeria TaxID=348720 RepID=A0A8S4SMZ5_9NEOP|nr:jg8417 [Pararge aegeria aegeria]